MICQLIFNTISLNTDVLATLKYKIISVYKTHLFIYIFYMNVRQVFELERVNELDIFNLRSRNRKGQGQKLGFAMLKETRIIDVSYHIKTPLTSDEFRERKILTKPRM